jgi:hypothetical protein
MLSEGLGFIDFASPLAGKSFYADGFLEWQQSGMMTDRVDYFNNQTALNFEAFFNEDVNGIIWPKVISNYLDRDGRPKC